MIFLCEKLFDAAEFRQNFFEQNKKVRQMFAGSKTMFKVFKSGRFGLVEFQNE